MVVGSHETRGAGEPDSSKHVDAALRGSQNCEDHKVTMRVASLLQERGHRRREGSLWALLCP